MVSLIAGLGGMGSVLVDARRMPDTSKAGKAMKEAEKAVKVEDVNLLVHRRWQLKEMTLTSRLMKLVN